jgi:hypothetical protein
MFLTIHEGDQTMRTKCLLALSVLLFLTIPVQAQLDLRWEQSYGGDGIDWCTQVVQTPDNGYALAGYTESFGVDGDFWLVRTDSRGDSLWSRAYGGAGRQECYAFVQTQDGGYGMAGINYAFENGDGWFLRLSPEGDSLWSINFGGEAYDDCNSVVTTADGGFVLAGGTKSFGVGEEDYWMMKIDSAGQRVWSHTFGGISYDCCRSFAQMDDGGFALGGESTSFGFNERFWLIKTNENGDSLWSLLSPQENYIHFNTSLIQTTDGDLVMSGYQFWIDSREDFYMTKISDGEISWARSYGDNGRNREFCFSTIQTLDGGFLMAGLEIMADQARKKILMIRTNNQGDSLWSQFIEGETGQYCFSIIQDVDGGYVVAGLKYRNRNEDFFILKTGPDPVSVPNSDFILHPSAFILLEPYPNPFNGIAVASYELRVPGWVNLSIYDSNGRFVWTLVDGWKPFGEHEVVWNSAGYPAGLYWLQLTDNWGGKATHPVVLVK